MTLPEIAAELRRLAQEHEFPRLAELADEMRRRPARRRAPATSRRATPDLLAQIAAFARANPTLSHQEIGRAFKVNPGRVSEALRGKRA